MMKPEVREAWLDALGSGEYEQGQERLVSQEFDEELEPTGKETWCCLGVLTNLHAQATGKVKRVEFHFNLEEGQENAPDDLLEDDPLKDYYGDGESMPYYETMVWAGLSSADGNLLSELNDHGCSFDGIRAYIRRHL